MATGVRHKLRMGVGIAPLLLGACGEKASDGREPVDAGQPDADVVGGLEGLLADLADGVAGRACLKDEDCEGKNARCSPGRPDAVRSCTGLCIDDDHCGRDGRCLEVARLGGEPLSFCQKVCKDDSECDAELQCSQAFNVYDVLGGISELLRGADVSPPERGDTICQERPKTVSVEDGAVGVACEGDEQCGGGECITSAPWTPGGYCSGKCLEHTQCGASAGCARDFASTSLGLPGMCLLRCTDNSECRESEGYGCLPLPSPFFTVADTYCINRKFLERGFGVPLPGAGGEQPGGEMPGADQPDGG